MRVLSRFLLTAMLLAGFVVVQSAFADDAWRGCLTGTKGNYVLRSVDGNLYRLHSSDDIKHHIGQMVEVKGHVQNKDRDKAALNQAPIAQREGVTIPTVGIDVDHITAIAGACPAAGSEKAVVTGEVAPGSVSSTTTTTTTTTTAAPPVSGGVAAGVSSGVSGDVSEGVSGTVQSGVVTETAGKYQHFFGCLSGTKDHYMLRADDGNLYRLHSDKDIHEHVGDRVEIRGRIDNKDRDREAQANAPAAAASGLATEAAGINVEDIKSIARGCTNP